ncbi:NUDIX hydrolase [archaeon]|nr:NUDIX hydrolase [archaeon]
MRRKWHHLTGKELAREIAHHKRHCRCKGLTVPEWEIVLDADWEQFCYDIQRSFSSYHDKPHNGRYEADLETLLEQPRHDRTKRKAPIILFTPGSINDIDRDRYSPGRLIKRMAPPGYQVLMSNRFDYFYSDFYSGIDDALPSLVIATEKVRVFDDYASEACYPCHNMKKVCERRDIPFIDIPSLPHDGGSDGMKKKRFLYLKRALQRILPLLPPIDDEHFAKMFGVCYPIGEFEDRGSMVRMPYAVIDGNRIPVIAASTLVIRVGEMYLLMQEAKKGSGERRIDFSKWEFPGGRMEQGEAPSEAALRELSEETPYAAVVNGLVGVFARVNANGRLILKSVYLGKIDGRHAHPLADDSLGHGFFDRPTIRYLNGSGLLKTSDQIDMLKEAARIGINRRVYNVADVDHPGVVRLLASE